MSAVILDGRREAQAVLSTVKRAVTRQRKEYTLATVIVGKKFDSVLYVRLKEQAAARVGIRTESIRIPASSSQQNVLRAIRRLNRRPEISGILLQLPLPSHLETDAVIQAIDLNKDIDGLRPESSFVSPFLLSILHLLKRGQPLGPRAVVLARDSTFSARLTAHLEKRGFTVSVHASATRIPPQTKKADVIISLLGRGPRLTSKDVRRGAVVIDAGIRQREGKTIGDADPSVQKVAKAISPVPGGVGPLTIAYLLKNLLTTGK